MANTFRRPRFAWAIFRALECKTRSTRRDGIEVVMVSGAKVSGAWVSDA
jgi:hypothetical protein